jgi:PAS domain-containing protein
MSTRPALERKLAELRERYLQTLRSLQLGRDRAEQDYQVTYRQYINLIDQLQKIRTRFFYSPEALAMAPVYLDGVQITYSEAVEEANRLRRHLERMRAQLDKIHYLTSAYEALFSKVFGGVFVGEEELWKRIVYPEEAIRLLQSGIDGMNRAILELTGITRVQWMRRMRR